jgi:hypothetical protein
MPPTRGLESEADLSRSTNPRQNMKKLKFVIIGAALAALAIPSVASADVARCDATVAANTTVTTATFTVNQPKDTTHQFTNVWRHEFSVVVLPDGSFSGHSEAFDNGAVTPTWTEDVTGSFNADKTRISFATVPTGAAVGGATFKVTDAPYNTEVNVETNWTANTVEFMIGSPVFTADTTTTVGTESVKNHGEFVKAMKGGKVAAQACAGMPLVSTQGK